MYIQRFRAKFKFIKSNDLCSNIKIFFQLNEKGNLCTKPSKLDIVCEDNKIDHRLTKPATPKTNGMVERVNGTILKTKYENKNEMISALNIFLIHYMLYRRHGGVRKELNIKTPFNALEKQHELKWNFLIKILWVLKLNY